jgi:hypothetical protein
MYENLILKTDPNRSLFQNFGMLAGNQQNAPAPQHCIPRKLMQN